MKNTRNFKYSVGDVVVLKDNLIIGGRYTNEDGSCVNYFSYEMSKNIGKIGVIKEIVYGGYKIEFDKSLDRIHTYVDGMIDDGLEKREYIFNPDVEFLLYQVERNRLKELIDKGLEERQFETDPEGFQKLVDRYKALG